jgi:general secretion pathway protein A
MYTAFYGLREKPFALSPDPRFLYLAGSHREALAHLLYGIEQGEGFISVTGEVGTGKTTLCRTLLERLEGDVEVAFLFNPSRTALELLQSICAEFDLPAEGLTRRTLMTQLNNFLVEQKQAGRRVLLIIDEAQTLSDNTLEQVRLLSNLETSRDKLIQILLLGQPELDRKLDGQALRQLRQRISVRWKLDPLSDAETRAYVRHRLSVAAGEPKDLFSEAALREIHLRTGGIPRLVNQLCDRALLAGYADRAAEIGPRLIRAAAAEIPDARHPRERRRAGSGAFFRPWMMMASIVLLISVALIGGLFVGRGRLTDAMQASVFKPWDESASLDSASAVVAARGGSQARPAVGANATRTSAQGAAPSMGQLIDKIPTDLREDLKPTPGQLGEFEDAMGARDATGKGASTSGPNSAFKSTSVSARIGASAQPAPVTALAPGLLTNLLVDLDARAALAASQSAALARFGRMPSTAAAPPRDAESLRTNLEARGLLATPFDGGSLALIRRLEHPVLLPLSPLSPLSPSAGQGARSDRAPSVQQKNWRWVAITGFDGDRAEVAGLVDGRITTVPISDLEAHWLETGIIVWESFEDTPTLLAEGAQGKSVVWLQSALAELRHFKKPPTGLYDATTLSAVAAFQRERGLVADGVAGPLTQIALYGQLTRYPVPRLSAGVAAPRLNGERG